MLVGCATPDIPSVGPLKSPFDVEARRALIGTPQGRFTCPATPAPMSNVLVEEFYTDSNHSIIDPVRYEARMAVIRPINQFVEAVTRTSDSWLISKPMRPEAVGCALAILDTWASANAMLGRLNMMGGFERKWTLIGISLAYLKLRNAPGIDPAVAARIEAWIGRLGHAVKDEYPYPRGIVNNHLYWAALAATSSGIVTGDHRLFDWGIKMSRVGLSRIKSDGTLTLEVDRGSKALHYHNFSAAPLVAIAELAMVNGIDLYGQPGGPLHRLANRVATDIADPSYMVRLTGKEQDWVGGINGWQLAWVEIWYARTRDPSVLPLLCRYRPMNNSWLGGNMTFAFGVKELPPKSCAR